MIFPVGEVAALGAAMIWAFTSVVFTSAGRAASPVAVNTFKTTAASIYFALVLLVLGRFSYFTGVDKADLARLALSGLLGLTLGDSALFHGYLLLGTRRAMLVYSLSPVMGAVGGRLLLGETMGPRALTGMVLALAGVACVIGERRASVPGGTDFSAQPPGAPSGSRAAHPISLGVVLSLVGAFGQAAGALLAKPALARVDTLPATFVRLTAGALGLLLVGALGGTIPGWTRLIIRERLVRVLLLTSFFGPFVGIWLMLVALDHTSTGIALTLLSTTPVWLLPVGAWLQKDHPSVWEIVGALVAVGGMALLLIPSH